MEIEFGNLEQSQPQTHLRPDQDGHFIVATIGEPAASELKIFVDLDVQRDMEAHARTNTRVELGGVMLGQQCVDDCGQPFVLVTDSLRAEHYEATKGSFKFTHETWSQITRQRKKLRPDLEMVGWYHTHPGWSVFLSGMDLFICNNFFNRPLDVALVIDPCADDRGWFQWLPANSNQEAPVTARTSGFFLTTNRFRASELDHFARLYNRQPIMNHDPRYATHVGGNLPSPSNSPGVYPAMVSQSENHKSLFEIALMSMLLMQFLLFAVVSWKLLQPAQPLAQDSAETTGTKQIASLQQKLDELESSRLVQTRQQAYQEVLQTIVGAQTGQNNLVENFAELKTANEQLQSNLTAQMALAEKLGHEAEIAKQMLAEKTESVREMGQQLVTARQRLDNAQTEIAKLTRETKSLKTATNATNEDSASRGTAAAPAPAGIVELAWWWLVLGAVGLAAIFGPLGYWWAGFKNVTDSLLDDRNDQSNPERSFGQLSSVDSETNNEPAKT